MRRVAVHFKGGPWADQTAEVERVVGPVFAVGNLIGNHYWLDTKSDPPTYVWDGSDFPKTPRAVAESQSAARSPIRSTNAAFDAVLIELHAAQAKFGPFASAHEGYAVLLEEVDELWHEVKHGSIDRQREEAVQVAAMALRFLIDVTFDVSTTEGGPTDG